LARRHRRWSWRQSPTYAAITIGVHGLVYLLLAFTPLGKSCTPDHEKFRDAFNLPPLAGSEPIDVQMLEPSQLGAVATLSDAERAAEVQKKIEEAKKPEEQREAPGQVVEIAKPQVEIRPDDARFSSEYDSKVEHQTKAPSGRHAAAAAAASPGQDRSQSPQQRAQEARPEQRAQAGGTKGHGELAMRNRSDRASLGGSRDGLERSAEGGTEAHKGSGERPAVGELQESRPGGDGKESSPELPPLAALRPSDQQVMRSMGASGSPDMLKDVDDGEETLLSTKRWKYASFFNRVKRAVAENWHPQETYQLRDPTGQIYGLKNRMTVLKVSLKPDGKLSNVLLEKPCGVDFLDDEAITAFQAAQPFPNPPPGLVDKDSQLITFRFGFFFEISGSSPSFKVFRY
jgi:TonB family protein